MSGIGEVLAIVSCVAGLIQAYDAGSRIVSQIKARRQAHGALPPSDLLEESIDKGRREIKQLVEDGKKRFGPSFEEGDTTAQLALYKITIATQQALLDGLTQAREDDGIIDFDYCIDTSDKGRNEALLALHQLFQRKLEQEMERKRSNPSTQPSAPESPSSPPPYQPAGAQKDAQPTCARALPEEVLPPTPLSKTRKSRTFGEIVFRRRSSHQKDQNIPRAESPVERVGGTSPRASLNEIKPLSNRRNTNASIRSNATWSSTSSESTAGRPGSILRSNTTTSSVNMVSRRDTTFSAMSGMSAMLTASAMSNMSITPITKYGACCKYAYEIREGNTKKGLMLQMSGFYGGAAFFACASTKCEFHGAAAYDKKGYRMDNRVFTSPVGIQYRFLFLAKSHVQQSDSRYPSYRCLVCIFSKDDSAIYSGSDSLLAHIADHQGAYLGDTLIEGRLTFDNQGAKASEAQDFDLQFPDVPTIEPQPVPEQGVAVVVAGTLPLDAHCAGRSLPSKAPSITSYAYEPDDDNPWANEGQRRGDSVIS